ncbi:hypothetical protein Lalb_Chr05g0219871 [Lupinus albus]|uniref:Uncharacterized protein n=1 Tax=Lupinus albus TaxID=3870 RepID=A0A6A4QJN4_LUPAL|nr:hypothetical protein Lalb_Chr05g0219871 [Lupinus albus]
MTPLKLLISHTLADLSRLWMKRMDRSRWSLFKIESENHFSHTPVVV